MTDEELMKAKEQVLADLTEHLPDYADRLNAIDTRLTAYIEDAISNHGSHSNLYELLGIRKELRLMSSYEMDADRVRRTIRAIEGQWRDGRHVKGGLEFDTPRGNIHVRLMPYQVWCIFGIYAFVTDVDMQRDYQEGDMLLPTEYVKQGRVWDKRRLRTEAHIFQTRKSGKTEFGAAIDFVEACFLGPANSQVLICSNSKEQSDIAMKAVKDFAYQIDPTSVNRMGGRFFSVTASRVKWQPGNKMKGEIRVLTAGGKASRKKDGLYASIVHADEHGSATYINGASDMQSLVEVCWGSTGPRRKKLLMHTTTAGLTHEGPYKNQLEQVQQMLLQELDHPLGVAHQDFDDKWFAFLLQLDPWEMGYSLEQLDCDELFRKVNRSIGTTVQPTYYRERLHDARLSDDTRKEVMTKDFNIFQNEKTIAWKITPEHIRRIQHPMRIGDCHWSQGWRVFVGLDFSNGDDLWAVSYFAVNYADGLEMKDRFFADCEAYVVESELERSPNRELYRQWQREGWLKVVPGEVFDSNEAVNTIIRHAYPFSMPDGTPDYRQPVLDYRMFGYDPAQSRDPINQLKAWLQSLFMAQGASGADIVQRIRSMVIPVSESFMTVNPILGQLETYILTPWLRLSMSPLWGWQVGNAQLITSRDETLAKIIKSKPQNKVDNLHALIDAIYGYELSEGNIQTE